MLSVAVVKSQLVVSKYPLLKKIDKQELLLCTQRNLTSTFLHIFASWMPWVWGQRPGWDGRGEAECSHLPWRLAMLFDAQWHKVTRQLQRLRWSIKQSRIWTRNNILTRFSNHPTGLLGITLDGHEWNQIPWGNDAFSLILCLMNDEWWTSNRKWNPRAMLLLYMPTTRWVGV